MLRLLRLRAGRSVLLLAALALVAAGCLGEGSEGDGEGGTVTMLGALVDTDQERLLASIEPWAEENGITIEYEGSGDFETLINTRVEGGNPPDIALFPQPGLMKDIATTGALRDVSDVIDLEQVENNFNPSVVELGRTDDGDLVGVMYRQSIKSLVWYPEPAFEEAGYEVPETWDEMIALSDQIVEDGGTPWCIGIESSGATGWVATDWMEDIMLQTAGLDAYNDWVTNDLPFDSPEVRRAGELFAEVAFNEDYVLGGREGIVTTPFGESPTPLFEDPPGCYMHRQASFITAFFPEEGAEVEEGLVNFFPFPVIEEGEDENNVLIAGDLASLLTDNPAAEQLLAYMATPEAGEAWAAEGGFISPHGEAFDESNYPDDLTRAQADTIIQADGVGFDASDQMPGAVGAGSFWTEATSWINGDTDLDTMLANIDASWPADDGTTTDDGGDEEEEETE